MISYEQSKKILKKAKIKVKDESVISINSLNRVTSTNVYSGINYPADDNAAFDGVWNVYPFFASENIIISDIDRGLFIIRRSDF